MASNKINATGLPKDYKLESLIPILDSIDTEEGSLVRFVGLPTSGITEDGIFVKAGAFVVERDVIAKLIMRTEDLCGGVTCYPFSPGAILTDKKEADQLLHIEERLQHLRQEEGGLPEMIADWSDPRFSRRTYDPEERQKYIHLGKLNSSYGVYRGMDDGEDKWFIIVRGYDELASKELYDLIHGSSSSVHTIMDSVSYSNALSGGNMVRDRIARRLADRLGGSLEEGGLRPKIKIENHYNIVNEFSESDFLCYYHRCFRITSSSAGILFGLGRSTGYLLIAPSPEFEESKCFATACAFPMGYPAKHTRSSILKDKDILSERPSHKVHWCGIYAHNYKAHRFYYDPRDLAALRLELYGKQASRADVVFRVLGVNISCIPHHDISIEEALLFSPPEDETVPMFYDSQFVRQDMMTIYVRAREGGEPIGNFTAVVRSEDAKRGVFLVDKKLVQKYRNQ